MWFGTVSNAESQYLILFYQNEKSRSGMRITVTFEIPPWAGLLRGNVGQKKLKILIKTGCFLFLFVGSLCNLIHFLSICLKNREKINIVVHIVRFLHAMHSNNTAPSKSQLSIQIKSNAANDHRHLISWPWTLSRPRLPSKSSHTNTNAIKSTLCNLIYV